jgi:hypothetical protein
MTNLKRREIFAEEIYACDIDIDDSIIPKILELPKTMQSISKSNEGGWQCDLQKPNSIDFLAPLIKSCRENSLPLFEEYGILDTNTFNYWININYNGNYNVKHKHQGFMSGCVYIDVPENSGNLILHKQNIFTGIMKYLTKHTVPTCEIKPTKGLMVIFPSYLEHEVTPNCSSSPRISIAFNFS